MKKLTMILALATVTLVAVSCGSKKPQQEEPKAPKILVVFYSQTSNTKLVANEIATRLGADLAEIVAVYPYDGDFKATIDRGKKELDEGILPEIQPLAVNVADYDVVFIGYPIWFGTYAPPVATFISQVDLSGKKVVPFCTFGSGGLESSVKDLAKAEPNAQILEGYGVRAARLDAMPKEVDQFLKENGFIEGEYTVLESFHDYPMSEKEINIFNAAVGDYPMLHAKPEAVFLRNIPNGMEFCFDAVDLPREDNPDMPPMGKMQVYVIMEDGAEPEFTRVVR